MQENLRLLFSALWFPATLCLFTGTTLFVLTLGDYWEFFLGAVIAWAAITTIVWVVSLNA